MLHLASAQPASFPVELRPSRTNSRLFVVAINGVATYKIDKNTGVSRKIKLGPNDKAKLTAAGVSLNGDYVAKV